MNNLKPPNSIYQLHMSTRQDFGVEPIRRTSYRGESHGCSLMCWPKVLINSQRYIYGILKLQSVKLSRVSGDLAGQSQECTQATHSLPWPAKKVATINQEHYTNINLD